MGFLDGLIELGFKKDSEGNTIYYPWGVGSGFIVKSDDEIKYIRSLAKINTVAFGISFIAIYVIFIFWFSFFWFCLFLFTIYLVWCLYKIKIITKELPKSTQKLTWSEYVNASAKSFSWVYLIILGMFLIVGIILRIWILYKTQDWLEFFLQIIPYALIGATVGGLMYIKQKN
jgi:hypothetical protein